MAALERVMELQQQGISDSEIIGRLRQEGISPREIDEALNQSKIKSAVSQSSMPEGMEQSIVDNTPSPEYNPQQQMPQQDQNWGGYAETTQPYDSNAGSYYSGGVSTETITEIAEQVATEKLDKFTKKTGDLVKFKNEVEDSLTDLNERLKRIESSIESLQRDVIRKVGEFGESSALVHRDLENLHGTVSKLMNPLIDNYNELKKVNSKK
jgi:DNA-binding transcriptional MerR regulator